MPISKGEFTLIDEDSQHLFENARWYCNIKNTKHTSKPYVIGVFECRHRSKFVYLHRVIVDCPDGKVVDHINGDTLDNRRENLRICTASDNSRNKRLWKNEYKCVSRIRPRTPNAKERWLAYITLPDCNGKSRQVSLGRHDTPQAAALAYNLAAVQHFGEFACLNDI